jgi:hypothetical protein
MLKFKNRYKIFSFVPWGSRVREATASVRRTQLAVLRLRAQNWPRDP